MNSLKKLIKEYFKDTLYECDVVMRSSREKKLTIVTDNLRGVCGITVVTVTGPAQPVSADVEKTYLKVKFFQFEPTLEDHLRKMAIEARKIDGVHSFIPFKSRKVVSRIYRDRS
tara:strand:- start:12072 stop:12413 length:342 start_codon:yes stop_codon:yes gene_type:complete